MSNEGSWRNSNYTGDEPEKESILAAMEHLFAKYLDMRPLFFEDALPIKDEWNISPYLGVFPRVFNALCTNLRNIVYFEGYLNNAFSAPRIWTVDAGAFARLVRLPACEISLQSNVSSWSKKKVLPCPYYFTY